MRFAREPFPATRPEFAFSRNGSPRTNSRIWLRSFTSRNRFCFSPARRISGRFAGLRPSRKWSYADMPPWLPLMFCSRKGLVTKDSEITFSSNSGELRVGNDQKHRLRMDFPLLKARSSHISPALVEGLGAYPDEVYLGTNCLCVFGEEETVASLEPDFKILSGLDSCLGVIVTARTAKIGYHFVSRYFGAKCRDHRGSCNRFGPLLARSLLGKEAWEGKARCLSGITQRRGNQMRAQG